jgi:uncharacterized protein
LGIVVDFHTHLAPADTIQPWVVDWTLSVAGDELLSRHADRQTPAGGVRVLDAEGIDYAVVLADLHPKVTGITSNESVAIYCAEQPRLIPFACLNPHLSHFPGRDLRGYIEHLGMRGLKLAPSYGHFYPNDSALYPAYEVAQEFRIPVLVHTGISVFRGSKLKFADPLFMDEVAVDFPDLAIVLAHSGRGYWYDAAFNVARYRENVYLEISGLPPGNLLAYFPQLERVADRVLFGSDFPGVPSVRGNIAGLRALPLEAETIEGILGGNAARLLHLPALATDVVGSTGKH